MRWFRVYWTSVYNDNSRELELLAREVFTNRRGCPDGYGKFWDAIYLEWGDGETWGGELNIESDPLEGVKVWGEYIEIGEQAKRVVVEEFCSWYQLYRFLHKVVCDSTPSPSNIYADFWSFPVGLSDSPSHIEDFYENMIKPIQSWDLWNCVIYSDDAEGDDIKIYPLQASFRFYSKENTLVYELPLINSPEELRQYAEIILKPTYDKEAET